MFLPTNTISVNFGIFNMFLSIDKKSGLEAVKSVLLKRSTITPILFQNVGTEQGPHMSCPYSNFSMSKFGNTALQYHLQPTIWKIFQDNVLTIWANGTDTSRSLLDYLNQIDSTSKIKFTMQLQDADANMFLDLKLKFKNGKIAEDVFTRHNNSFTFVLAPSCYP